MSLRWNMIDSLQCQHDIKAMTKHQVLNLLGEPESKTNTEFGYYLGFSKRGINTGKLTIKFENNQVIDFLVTDG